MNVKVLIIIILANLSFSADRLTTLVAVIVGGVVITATVISVAVVLALKKRRLVLLYLSIGLTKKLSEMSIACSRSITLQSLANQMVS